MDPTSPSPPATLRSSDPRPFELKALIKKSNIVDEGFVSTRSLVKVHTQDKYGSLR